MFRMRRKGEQDVLVFIDGGRYSGNIDFADISEPECRSGGVSYSKLSDGEHTFHARRNRAYLSENGQEL